MTKANPKQKRGRPKTYKAAFARQAVKLCELGATDHELAEFFEVHTSTIYRWKHSHKEFCDAVIVGKESADARVERSLYNRAVGYTFETEKLFHYQGSITRAKTVEHVAPDPSAAFNWLKNRKPVEWRDKTETTQNVNFNMISDAAETARTRITALIEGKQREAILSNSTEAAKSPLHNLPRQEEPGTNGRLK